uniref:ATP-dependent Clp protease proteolytic subunit n=1 Tax=Silene kiusiana TaxID=1170223 RepID=A0A6J3XC76_9CARY|nr:ClpP [Silene kiusiana]AWX05950.1 ClpP [Silene kiusiana]
MPVGVPKVPFLIPSDEEASWVDLYRLYRHRHLFITQELDEEIGNVVMGLMFYLSQEDSQKRLLLFLNSLGGLAVTGLGVCDTMRTVPADVYTIGLGTVASMASFILMKGVFPKRIAFPHAVMIHQPASDYIRDIADNCLVESTGILRLREELVDGYSNITGKALWIINEDLERDTFMSAEDAQSHGIVDRVGYFYNI